METEEAVPVKIGESIIGGNWGIPKELEIYLEKGGIESLWLCFRR